MNLQKTKTVFLCFIFLMILFSCKEEAGKDVGEETSSFSLLIKADNSENVVVFSRAGEFPEESDFKVRIENTKAEVLREWDYDALPSVISVVPGSYKLVAWYGDNSSLPAFESPYFYGETKITLKEGDFLDTIINTSLAAAKVSVKFDDNFEYEYSEYGVALKTLGDSLYFSKEETREAYFMPGDLRLRFTLKPIGSEETVYYYAENRIALAAKDFLKMNLKVNSEKGGFSISLSTDSTTIDLDLIVDIPSTLLPKDAPTVTSQGFSNGSTISTTQGVAQNASVAVSSAAGLTSLIIKTESSVLLEKGWPQEVDLMSANEDVLNILKSNGLVFSNALTTEEIITSLVSIKFDDLIGSLEVSESSFEIIAKDKFDQTGNECKFTVEVNS